MDVTTTKMLSIHIDALLPPTSAELDLPHSAQVAAILGVGLVYQGTAQRRMAEVLLSEIGKTSKPIIPCRDASYIVYNETLWITAANMITIGYK